MGQQIIYVLFFFFSLVSAKAQRLSYARPSTGDHLMNDYEIIGNYNGNILVYKNLRSKSIISVYDKDMIEISRNDLDISPNKIVQIDFIAYPNFCYMVYQYMTQNVIFCMAAKLGADGKMMDKPTQLSYFDITRREKRRLQIIPYTILASEDKKNIMVLKADKNEEKYNFKTSLFDNDLQLKHSGQAQLPILNNNNYLKEFTLDNEGNLLFGNIERPNTNEYIQHYYLQEKPALQNYFFTDTVKLDNITLKDARLKVDNNNGKYTLTSFYYEGSNTSVQGIFHFVLDRNSHQTLSSVAIPLGNDVRAAAMGNDNATASSLDNFYLQNIIIKKDGSFLATAECVYVTIGNSPILPPNLEVLGFVPGNNQLDADNVLVLSIDKMGKLQSSNVILKSQFSYHPNGGTMGFAMINTSDNLLFLYNAYGKLHVRLPTFQTVGLGGQISLPSALLGFDNDYSLIWRSAKQTGLHQIIVPCVHLNFFTFCKLDF